VRTQHIANKVIPRGLGTMLQPEEACGYCSSIVLFLPDLLDYCYSCVRISEKSKDGLEDYQLCKRKTVHLQIAANSVLLSEEESSSPFVPSALCHLSDSTVPSSLFENICLVLNLCRAESV
jgi:hypothetical protein